MHRQFFMMVLALICATPIIAFGSYVPLVRAGETVAIPYKLSLHEIERAVIDGCAQAGWSPKKLNDGTIEATLHVRTHVAVVHITYKTESLRVDYVDSTNLISIGVVQSVGQHGGSSINATVGRTGATYIHENYYVWKQDLQTSILKAFAAAKQSSEASIAKASVMSVPDKLREIESLRKEGVITDDEYQKKKKQLLDQF